MKPPGTRYFETVGGERARSRFENPQRTEPATRAPPVRLDRSLTERFNIVSPLSSISPCRCTPRRVTRFRIARSSSQRIFFFFFRYARGGADGSRVIPPMSLDHWVSLRHEYFYPPVCYTHRFFVRREVRRPEDSALRSGIYRVPRKLCRKLCLYLMLQKTLVTLLRKYCLLCILSVVGLKC